VKYRRDAMIEKKCEGERLLEIDNLHGAECGPPPSLDAADRYLGYFENCCGEQWVFVGDRETGEAVIRGGDTGWETEYKVSLTKPCPADLVLSEEEKHWIIACIMAMSDTSYDAIASAFAAGDCLEMAYNAATALSEGIAARFADRKGRNGANGNGREEGIPEE
jgi:hypothetical protein